jgi:hypothetical protein
MTRLGFFLATRAAHAVALGLLLTLLAVSLLRSLALLPAATLLVALVAFTSRLSPLSALLLPAFGRRLLPVPFGTRLTALLLTASGCGLLAVAIRTRLTGTLALLLAILLLVRRVLFVSGLYGSAIGIAGFRRLLLASLPVAAISFLGI